MQKRYQTLGFIQLYFAISYGFMLFAAYGYIQVSSLLHKWLSQSRSLRDQNMAK